MARVLSTVVCNGVVAATIVLAATIVVAATITVHAPSVRPRVLEGDDVLDGGEGLPEFRCSTSDIFAWPM